MGRRLTAAVAATMLAVVGFAAPAGASHSNGYHWARTTNPFVLEIDDNVTASWDTYLSAAATDWSASSVLDTTVMQGSFGDRNSCAPLSGHVEVCNAKYGSTGWLTILSISTTTGNHITKASVKFNDTYLGQTPYNSPGWRQMLMCEQLGHTLGLANQDSDPNNTNLGSCMDRSSNPAGPPSNEHPNQHDYDELAAIYAHLDGFATTSGGSSLVHDGPASWGTLVSGQVCRGVGTFRRDLGSDNVVITRVVWAEVS
ncbi:MAG TPA: hypothetical protein VF163_07210 [Micromonosporaceae bacterium]